MATDYFRISNRLQSASIGSLARTSSSFRRPGSANGPLFLWNYCEPRLLASHPLRPIHFRDFSAYKCINYSVLQNVRICSTIWNLADVRYRVSDLRYRYITILQLKRSISSDSFDIGIRYYNSISNVWNSISNAQNLTKIDIEG